jgi:hypothetical protein
MEMRETIINAYYDYVNDYLSLVKWAERNGLTVPQAEAFMALARLVEQSPHPES